ncbi:hypothetical protein GCM10027610_048170 [Dactylosporangium cerinum]
MRRQSSTVPVSVTDGMPHEATNQNEKYGEYASSSTTRPAIRSTCVLVEKSHSNRSASSISAASSLANISDMYAHPAASRGTSSAFTVSRFRPA